MSRVGVIFSDFDALQNISPSSPTLLFRQTYGWHRVIPLDFASTPVFVAFSSLNFPFIGCFALLGAHISALKHSFLEPRQQYGTVLRLLKIQTGSTLLIQVRSSRTEMIYLKVGGLGDSDIRMASCRFHAEHLSIRDVIRIFQQPSNHV
jgi:hypothetical protein